MRPEVISSTLRKMVKHKHLRKMLAKRIDDYVYQNIVNDDSEDLQQVQVKRYHYEIFRNSVLPTDAKPEDENAKEALESDEYFEVLKIYDKELQGLTENIWKAEYLNV